MTHMKDILEQQNTASMAHLYNRQYNVPPVTKAQVLSASEAVSRHETKAKELGMQNVPRSPEERMKVDAELRIARDQAESARKEYRRLFALWARGGYQE